MKKFGKLLFFAAITALLTCLLCVALSAETVSGTCGAEGDGSNLTWTFDTETGVLKIEGKGAMADYVYNNWNGSNNYAPWYNYRSSIKTAKIGDGVTSIGDSVFFSCGNLTSITIPNSVTNIGSDAFSSCVSLTSIEIPSSITSIKSGAFSYCHGLTNIDIPSSVTSIGSGPFTGCSKLTSINVNEASKTYKSIDGVLFTKDEKTLIRYPENKEGTSYIISDSVTKIGGNAFYYCTGLTSITIPSSITSIESYAFDCCAFTDVYISDIAAWCEIEGDSGQLSRSAYNLYLNGKLVANVAMPNNVTSIRSNAFNNCRSITSVTFDENSKLTSIEANAFKNCTSLTSIIIPNSVTKLAVDAFSGCDNLQYNGYDNAMYLGNPENPYYALIKVSDRKISSCIINEQTKVIATYAFNYCGLLTEITIPESVKSISGIAFRGCYKLSKIFILSKDTEINNLMYGGNYTVYGYTGSSAEAYAEKYKKKFVPFNGYCGAEGDGSNIAWYFDFKTGELSLNGTGEMKEYINTSQGVPWFLLNLYVKSVDISDGITHIGSNAFYGCRYLKSIYIPKDVISFGIVSIFAHCDALETMTVAEENTVYHSEKNCIIETASKTLKFGCKTSIIPDDGSVTSIGVAAFNSCKIENITIPECIVSIGASAFVYCDNLTSITIPKNVTSIGGGVLGGCSNLENIYVDAENTAYYVKNNCLIEKETKTLIAGCNDSIIPDDGSVTVIGSNALSGRKMIRVTIPNGITTIESFAFSGCPNLESVSIPNSVTAIKEAFTGNLKLTHITIPASVTAMSGWTFWYCDNLANITILSKDVEIFNVNCIPEIATIYGYSGSTAEAYATKYNRKFVAIDKYNSMNAGATLNENITMNFIGTALTKEDVDGNDFKMTFVMNGSKTSVSPVEKNGKYTFPFAGIAPQCMNDEISYEMTMNGAVVKQGSTSVSGYLKQLIEKKPDNMTDAKFKAMSTLVSDMLNYGSAAQAYTGHGTDSLLNKDYYNDIVNNYTELESTDKALSGAAPAGAKFTNVGVRFDNVNKVFFRFTADDVSNVIITINGVAYEQDKFVKTGDKYTVYSEDVLASKFDTVYTAILTYRGLDEQQMMTYSVKSFAYSFQNKRGENGKLTAEAVLARATYTYGVSAKAYENAE